MVSHLGEVKIDNRPAVGLKIATKGRPDVDLFFDKETSLPLRAEVRVTEPMQANEVVYAFYFADYKDVDGIKQYSKMTFKRDDEEFHHGDGVQATFKFREKLDNTLFAKPCISAVCQPWSPATVTQRPEGIRSQRLGVLPASLRSA